MYILGSGPLLKSLTPDMEFCKAIDEIEKMVHITEKNKPAHMSGGNIVIQFQSSLFCRYAFCFRQGHPYRM